MQELGQCHREKLTNRTKAMVLELGINLQDIRVQVSMETNLRLIRNQRNNLTYIPDKIWHICVKDIARYNKEVRISGQNSNMEFDPRKIPNSEELEGEIGEQYKKEREKELRYINLKKQTPTKDQLERDKVETYKKEMR